MHAEFTKSRLRRKCGSIEDLKALLTTEKGSQNIGARPQPRWVRINRLRTSLLRLQDTTFSGFTVAKHLSQVVEAKPTDHILYIDPQVPDLIAVPPDANLTKTDAYERGEIILQDKASCFPAHLLLGTVDDEVGELIDGCAAPGNKTTHLAAILGSHTPSGQARPCRIYACERDAARAKTLQRMVDKAGPSQVQVMARQDFLALNPHDPRFADVTHLLLDPSCSGSGIVGREDVPSLSLPVDPRAQLTASNGQAKSKKRKRNETGPEPAERTEGAEEQPAASAVKNPERLAKLAEVQSRIVEHALSFPNAHRITYSTCSVHCEENELVVARILQSTVARQRGWRVLRRKQQPEGFRVWPHRGIQPNEGELQSTVGGPLGEEDLDGCIRCYPHGAEGTMGFFVVCFERDSGHEPEEDEWAGFSDGDS